MYSRLSSLGNRQTKRNKATPPSFFLQKRKKFAGGHATKTVQYVRDILCIPASWCKNPGHVTIPRGERRNYLAENGLLGKIEFNSEMTAKDIRLEVCKVFVSPMGLSEDDIREGKTVKFRFLQRTGAGSRTLCVPSVAEEFEWNARHVSTLAKSGGIIYVQAVDELIGLEVSSAYNKYVKLHHEVLGSVVISPLVYSLPLGSPILCFSWLYHGGISVILLSS